VSSWRISSCFDCKLLQETNSSSFYCTFFKKALSYDIARTVNDCEHKVPFEQEKSHRELLLDVLYVRCVDYVTYVMGPFTAREMAVVTGYSNKNSIWQMLEDLVIQGRLHKGKMVVYNRYGNAFKTNVYFPVWPQEVRPAILSQCQQVA
jgi:hypothetical protein